MARLWLHQAHCGAPNAVPHLQSWDYVSLRFRVSMFRDCGQVLDLSSKFVWRLPKHQNAPMFKLPNCRMFGTIGLDWKLDQKLLQLAMRIFDLRSGSTRHLLLELDDFAIGQEVEGMWMNCVSSLNPLGVFLSFAVLELQSCEMVENRGCDVRVFRSQQMLAPLPWVPLGVPFVQVSEEVAV